MNKCNVCDREFTTKSALVNHSKKCVGSKEELEVGKDISEAKEELVEPSRVYNELELEKLRLLGLLALQITSCLDAESKYKLEQEFIDKGGDILVLRKSRKVDLVKIADSLVK